MRIVTISRLITVVAIFAAAVSLLPAPARSSSSGSSSSLTGLQTAILARINQIRVARSLVPLRLNRSLWRAANEHSAEMLSQGYFAHSSADGSSFSKRVRRYYDVSGPGSCTVGENLLWTSSSLDARQAVSIWMASPEHRANILWSGWREIGIAAHYEPAAPGIFKGSPVTMVTTDFGVRN
jgi:uncharacterized protein YkwD